MIVRPNDKLFQSLIEKKEVVETKELLLGRGGHNELAKVKVV